MLAKYILEVIPLSVRKLRKLASEHADGTYTIQQIRILFLIKAGMGQSQMADALHVSDAAISKMISGLEAKKMITKCQGADKRSICLGLTAEGKKIERKVSLSLEKKLNSGIKLLTDKETHDLHAGLKILQKLMSFE